MKVRFILMLIFSLMLISTSKANDAQEEFKKYLNDKSLEVKEAKTAEDKREILDNMFHRLLEAADYAESWPLIPDDEKAGIVKFKMIIEEKHDELNGTNGFNKIADASLDRFADYSVQEIEQAQQYVTISVLTLVLIIILVAILL